MHSAFCPDTVGHTWLRGRPLHAVWAGDDGEDVGREVSLEALCSPDRGAQGQAERVPSLHKQPPHLWLDKADHGLPWCPSLWSTWKLSGL